MLLGATALAVAVGVSSIAFAATRSVNQTATGNISPVKLPKKTFKNTKLDYLTTTKDSADSSNCVSPNPPADGSCRVPPTADHAYLDFDNDIRFKPASVGKCQQNNDGTTTIDGLTTNQARTKCKSALVGVGSAVARLGAVGGPTASAPVPARVSAFNGTPNGSGNPTFILYVDPGFSPFALIGKLVNSSQAGDYKKRLDLPVVSPGTTLIRFGTTVGHVKNPSLGPSGDNAGNVAPGPYIQARCRDKNHVLDFHALFHYGDTGIAPNDYPAAASAFSTDKCKVKRRRHH